MSFIENLGENIAYGNDQILLAQSPEERGGFLSYKALAEKSDDVAAQLDKG